jgi:hypothetical protein
MIFYTIIPVHVPWRGQNLLESRFFFSFILKSIFFFYKFSHKATCVLKFLSLSIGAGVAWWLRWCATSRTVSWSIPVGETGFFIDIFLSGRTKSLESTQPQVKMSARNIRVVKAGGVWDWISHHLHAPNIMKILESKPPGTLWATPVL